MHRHRLPTVDDLAADVIEHHFDDMIAPPGLTNMLGTVVVGHDLTGIRGVTFPPFSQGSAATATLFLDGRLFESYGIEVSHDWRPDRVVRTAVVGELAVRTTTVCVPGRRAVAIDIEVRNHGAAAREVSIGLSLAAAVTRCLEAWNAPEMPAAGNDAVVDAAGNRIVFTDGSGAAWCVQGLDAHSIVRASGLLRRDEVAEAGIGGMERGGDVTAVLTVPAGGRARVGYVHTVGSRRADAEAAFDAIAADVPAAIDAAQRFWDDAIAAMFDPALPGSLPVLETSNDALRRVFEWGAFGVLWFRREFEGNVFGRSYDTLMPNYWSTTTFLWDYSLSSTVHAMLDPLEMRGQLLAWIGTDIHAAFGTSSLTGGPVGRWYSVNDYAMIRMVTDYVRITGDEAFLDEMVAAGDAPAQTVLDHLVDWATAWRELRRAGRQLADYGAIDNLLECVSTYTHEVASLNAANVWCMRTVAELLERRGERERADDLRAEAATLLEAVLDLEVPRGGHFVAQQPDGTRIPVRHSYDFSTVGTLLADDLPDSTRDDMVAFFRRELQTETWMRSLSPWDPDASYSVRPDHQWNGAYPAWPADAARALIALGAGEVAAAWVEGLARSANQGPPGQAHFVEEAWPAVAGGARKAPPQLPYINDWACSSAGAWVQLVVEGLFGLRWTGSGTPVASGPVAMLDPDAVLRGVMIGGQRFDVYADGRIEPCSA